MRDLLLISSFLILPQKKKALLLDREEVLVSVVLELVSDEVRGHLGGLILEASGLNGAAINGEGIVVEELGVEVGGEGGDGDASGVAHLTPGLEMLVVDILDDGLEAHGLGHCADEGAVEAGLDGEELLEDLVDLLLGGVVLVREVEERGRLDGGGAVPHGAHDISDVDGVVAEVAGPQEFHLLVEVLVHSGADDAGCDALDVAGAVHGRGTQDDEGKPCHGLEALLGLEVGLGLHGPGLELGVLLGRLLAGVVHLRGAEVHKALDGVLDGLGGDLHAHAVELVLVDGLLLTELGLGGAVEHVVELLPAINSEALGNGLYK